MTTSPTKSSLRHGPTDQLPAPAPARAWLSWPHGSYGEGPSVGPIHGAREQKPVLLLRRRPWKHILPTFNFRGLSPALLSL